MPRKAKKSITTTKKDKSSGINTKSGGKVIKKQPTSIGRKVKTANIKCPKCSKPLLTLNKTKSGVCVACLKNESNNKSKNTVVPKSSLKPTKQVLNSSRKSNSKSNKSSNSPKTNSQKNIINATSSRSTLPTRTRSVKSSSTPLRDQPKTKNVTGKSKLTQSSKTDTMNLRGSKRSYTQMARGASIEQEKTQKKRKINTSAEQLSKRESRNKKPTIKGSEWMNTIRSKRVSNQQEAKLKKETPPLKNKSPKSNSKIKNNIDKRKVTPTKTTKTANKSKTNKIDPGIVPHKPIKRDSRTLKTTEDEDQISINSKKLKSAASQNTLQKLQSTKGKNIISSSKKSKVAKKNKTEDVKKDGLAKYIKRQRSVRSIHKEHSPTDFQENVLIAKDIINNLLESIPPFPVDEISVVNICDLDSIKLLEEKSTDKLTNLDSVKSKQNNFGQVKNDTDHNLYCNSNSVLHTQFELEDKGNLVLLNNSTHIDTKCEQTDVSKDTLREETGSVNVMVTDDLKIDNHDGRTHSSKIGLSEDTLSEEKGTIVLRENEKIFVQSAISYTNNVDGKNCISENYKKNLCLANAQNNLLEEMCCLENDKSKINSRDQINIEENFINVSEKENVDAKSISNVTENITHTTPVNPKMVGDNPNHKNVLEDITDSSKEKESDCNRQTGVENEEEMTVNKSIMSQETNVEENSVSVQSESTAIKTKFDEDIKIVSSVNHQSDKTFVNELSTNDKCSKFSDKVGIGGSVNEIMINKSTDGPNWENDNIAYSSNKSGDCDRKLSIEVKTPESKLNSIKNLVAEEYERNMVLSNNSSCIDSKCEQTDVVKDTLREETGSVNVIVTDKDSIKENVSNYEAESVSELSSSKNSFQNEANEDYSDNDINSMLTSDLKADGIRSHQNNIQIHSSSEIDRFNIDNNRTDAILCSQNNIIMDTSSSEHGGFLTSDSKTTNSRCDQSNGKKDSIINRIDLVTTDILITNSLHSEKNDIKDPPDHHISFSTGNNGIDSTHNENKHIKDTVSNGIGHYTELSPGSKPIISTISCENDATRSLNTNFEQNAVLPTISTFNQNIDFQDSSESGRTVAASLSTENISGENNDSKNTQCFEEAHNALLPTDISCDENDFRENSKDRINLNHDTTLPICRKITNDDNDTLNSNIGHNNTILLRDSKNPEKLLCDENCVVAETLTSDIHDDVSVNVNKRSDDICNQNNIIQKISQSAVDVCMLPTDGELVQSNYIKKGLCIEVDNSCENVLLVESKSDTSSCHHSEPGIVSLHTELGVENKNEFTLKEKSSIDKNSSTMTDDMEVNTSTSSNTSRTVTSNDLHIQTENIKTDSTSNEINFRKPTETDIQDNMDSPGKIELKNNSSQNERMCIGSKIGGLGGLDCDTTQFKNGKEFAQDKNLVQTIFEQLDVSTDTSVGNSETPIQLSSNVEATINDVSSVNDCIEHSGTSDHLSSNIEEAVISVNICDVHSETNVQSSFNVKETVEDYSRPNVDDSAVHTETHLQMSSSVEDRVKDDINVIECDVHSGTLEQSSSNVEETEKDVIRRNVDDNDLNTETDLQISSNVEDRVKDDINVTECDAHSGTPEQSSLNVEETVEDVIRRNVDDNDVNTETDLQISSNVEDRVKDDVKIVECDVHSGTPVQSSSNVEETVEDVSRRKVDDCGLHSEIHLQVSSRVEDKVEDIINVNDCTVLSETPFQLSSNVEDSVKDIISTNDFVVVPEIPVQLTTSVEETVENVCNVNDCVVLSGTAAPLPSSIEDSVEDVIHVDDCIVNVEAPFQLSSNVKDRVSDVNVDDCVALSETVRIPSNGGEIGDDVITVDDDVESMQCNSETQSSSNRMSVDEDNIEMELDTENTSRDNPPSAMNVDAEMNMEVN